MIFDTTGRVVASGKALPDGDWKATEVRVVGARATDGSYYMPAEDVTARLMGLGPSGFAYVLQSDPNLQPTPDDPVPAAFLIRFDSLGIAGDTIDTAPAPRDYISKARPGRWVDQAWYTGRPLWASGDNWLARGHGDSATIVVAARTGLNC